MSPAQDVSLSYVYGMAQHHLESEIHPHQFEIWEGVLDEPVHALRRSHPELCRERIEQELMVFVARVDGVHQKLLDR